DPASRSSPLPWASSSCPSVFRSSVTSLPRRPVSACRARNTVSRTVPGLGQVLEQRRQHRNDCDAGIFEAEGLDVQEVTAVLVAVVPHVVQSSLPWQLWTSAARDAEVQ